MHIDINLATQPYEDLRKFWLRWGGPLAALGILTLWLLYSVISGLILAHGDNRLIRERQDQIASRDKEKSSAQALLNQPQNRAIRDRSQFLNDLFQRKAFSWTKVFEDMEQVMPARLHVVAIHPEMGDDNQLAIKLQVAGESRDRALELVRRMEASKRFQQTHIISERELQGKQGDNVQFEINALYVPETIKSTAPSVTNGAAPSKGGF
ncbi:MAG TPA: PilN domain-containing protein [Terriglobales bacterium]|nr:PilN domain-containing protein [Terriglobales bacterium]